MNDTDGNVLTPEQLFHAGESVNAFDFFGAHILNGRDKGGAVFRVWAPNAAGVAVVGDFNGWSRTVNPMQNIGDGVWELLVENACALDKYKYSIETKNGEIIEKSDPFAFYGEHKSGYASIVYELNGFSWSDEEWLQARKARNSLDKPMNIYEMHIGSWRRDSDGNSLDYKTLADELAPYLKDMGYTHVQFMPVTEYPNDKSWGFQTTGYFAATSRYGEPKDFMYLVNKLHSENIGIILDWVPSNFPNDSFGLSLFDGEAVYENEQPELRAHSKWKTSLFDYSRREVISFLVSSAVFWIQKYHIDGIRAGSLTAMLYLDYGKQDGDWTPNIFGGKENLEAVDFIKRLTTAIRTHGGGALSFAEENTSWQKLTRPVEEGGLGFDYKWNRGWMNDMLHYMSLNPLWRPFNHDNLTYSFFYAFSEHYLLPVSHDEVASGKGSLIGKMPGEFDDTLSGVRSFITYMYAHPGKKLVFMGTEIGQLEEWSASKSIQWDLLGFQNHEKLQQFFKDINKFYLENKPFYELDTSWKGFDWIHHDDYINSVIAFKRTDSEGNEIIAVCNFQPVKHEKYYIGVPRYAPYDEVFSSDNEKYGGTGVSNGKGIMPEQMKIHGCDQGLALTLPPYGVIYLKSLN